MDSEKPWNLEPDFSRPSQNEDLLSSNIQYGEIILRSMDSRGAMYMGIGNYTNLSEIMNSMLEAGHGVALSDMVREAENRKLILASEGEQADQADLENAFIALADIQYRAGMIALDPENEMEDHLIQLYISGDLAKNGYGGKEGDSFLRIKWIALSDNLPVITNINL